MNGEKKHIILVDDISVNLLIGKNVLSEKYTVATAESAKEMFGLLENCSPDMILLDVDMPEVTGYEAIKILKENSQTKDIPVIFLTSRTASDDIVEGLSLGAIDYLSKPYYPSFLLKRLEIHFLAEARKKTKAEALVCN